MKLFVWSEPYSVKWGSTMLIVVAETLDDAKQQAAIGKAYRYTEFEQEHIPMDAARLGEPTRIVDLPCAEWHLWEE